jgi:uncharacterized membrane protein YjgN (DUF898 family)
MAEAAYAVVFKGEVVEGFEREQVKAAFARLFGLGAERLEELFAHPFVVLKRGLSHADGTRYVEALRRIGAVATLELPGQAAGAAALAAGLGTVAPAAPPSAVASPAAVRSAAVPPAAAPPAAAAPAASDEPRLLPFEFHGEGFEFFRIWIVNLLLSIVTLGIYSAWAKVRTLRYFYGNTRLDGSSFEYLATPVQILKGRLVAFVLLLLYLVLGEVFPLAGAVLALVLMLATPWIVVRSLAFRNRHSAWRGVRFGFDGGAGAAAKAFLLWPLAGVLTLGLLVPLALQRQQRFLVEHSRYGTSAFAFEAGARAFYALFLQLLLVFAGGGVLAFFLGQAFAPLGPLTLALTYLVGFAWFNTGFTNLVYGHSRLDAHRLVARYELPSYLRLMAGNALGMVLTLGLFYPWARVRNARYAAAHIDFAAADDLGGFVADQRRTVGATGGELADLFDVDLGL